jgi:mannosyltransferase
LPTSRRWGVAILGLAIGAIGLLLPRGWYDASPWNPEVPHPAVKGVTLLQASLVLEGAILAVLGWAGWRADWGSARLGLTGYDAHVDARFDVSRRIAILLLAGITALALALRLIQVNADLWIDEIAPVVRYRQFTPFEVVTTYLSSNNHMLNTLLVKGTTRLFGEREWAIRLPAVLFGVAGIPALYWLARLAASRLESLGIALLLAVSYHQVFFSQNARGYTGYLFFSTVATGLFAQGLLRDRRSTWAYYVCAMVANFAALLHSAFVFGAHVLIGMGAALVHHARGEHSGPLLRRLCLVFGATALLGFQLWATMLPQAYAFIRTEYASAASGFSITSGEFLGDVLTGLREGFGGALFLLLPAGLLGWYGFVVLLRRQWIIGTALALPLVLTAAVLAVRHLSASPRFFLLGLPLAAFAVVLGLNEFARVSVTRIARAGPGVAPRLAGAAIGILAMASLAALPRYYSVPKQPYRAAVAYARQHRTPGDVIVLVYTSEPGFRYYAAGTGLQEGRDFVAVQSVAALNEVVRANGAGHLMMITTFQRALLLELPQLYARLQAGWAPAKEFPATVHDGAITVWLPRPS